MKLQMEYDSRREVCVKMTVLEAQQLLKFCEAYQNQIKHYIKASSALDKIGTQYLWAADRDLSVKIDDDFAEQLRREG